ncbi:hypothetical protein O7626_39800 [Micromonospora sp. WMMD1102]|uniref:hypothetical protein n=1 Tax=Micromonospora sp. WMMD1102 TaxID=3016105 RepID=UPI0024156CAD|nr:hypothetical protein [Micromonospora sp. WMMD1102]MDG4791960.1 hypothetical protein [Micromonospora sp. WMMD1102]
MPETEYRITYTIERRERGASDFTEIGFGSSHATGTVDAAAYDVESQIQNRQWETGDGMPDPLEVGRG